MTGEISSIGSVGDSAFKDCRGLTGSLVINGDVGYGAFKGCRGLTGDLLIAGNVEAYAFFNCINLQGEVTLKEGVTSVGNFAFYYCPIKCVYFPSTIESISASTINRDTCVYVYKNSYADELFTSQINNINYYPVELEGISIDYVYPIIEEGASRQLTISRLPKYTTNDESINWESNNEDVLVVNEKGRIEAIEPGKATITAKVGEFSDAIEFTITEAAVLNPKVSINQGDLILTEQTNGNKYFYVNGKSQVYEGALEIFGEGTTSNKIIIYGSADIILNNVSIKSEGNAIYASSGDVKIALCNENYLKTSDNYAAIEKVKSDGKLTITSVDGDGSQHGYLEIFSVNGAAIGGNGATVDSAIGENGEDTNNIYIRGGTIYTNSGIGGGKGGKGKPGSNVPISTEHIKGGTGGTGGTGGDAENIIITGGDITATYFGGGAGGAGGTGGFGAAGYGSNGYTGNRGESLNCKIAPVEGYKTNAWISTDESEESECLNHCEDSVDLTEHDFKKIKISKHVWTDWITDKEPTCTEAGTRHKECSCGDIVTEEISAKDHDWDEEYTINSKATYTEEGSKSIHCSVCDATKDTIAIPCISAVSLSATTYAYSGKISTPAVTVKDTEGNVLNRDTDYTVSYASGRKSIGKYKVTVTFKGNYEGKKELYFTIGPKNPSKVYSSLYGYDDVKLSWSKVSGVSGYAVYYKKSKDLAWKYIKSTTSRSLKKGNLADGIKYDFKVVPYKTISKNKCYSSGKTSSVYTLKKISTPTVTKYSSGKVRVSWTNIAGESGYQISKSTKKSRTSIASTYKTTSGKSKVIKAKRNKTYYYKVRAYRTVSGKKVYGPWSRVVSYKVK